MTEKEHYIRVPKQMIKSVKNSNTLLAYGLIYLRTHGGKLKRRQLKDVKFRNLGISPSSLPMIKKELKEKCGISISGDNLYSIDRNSFKHFNNKKGEQLTEQDYYVDHIPASFIVSHADADIKTYYLALRAYTSDKTKRLQANRSTLCKEIQWVSRTKLWRMLNHEFNTKEILTAPYEGISDSYGYEFDFEILENLFSRSFKEFMSDKGLINRSLLPIKCRRVNPDELDDEPTDNHNKPRKTKKPIDKLKRSKFKATTRRQIQMQSRRDHRNEFTPVKVKENIDGSISYFDRTIFKQSKEDKNIIESYSRKIRTQQKF